MSCDSWQMDLGVGIEMGSDHMLDVAICSCNRPRELALVLESVLELDYDGMDCRILVIENGDRSKEQEKLTSQYANHPRVVLEYDPIAGLSRARNRALSLTTAQWLAFIDDDALPDVNWLRELVKTVKQFPNAGMIGGKVSPIFTSERPEWLTDDLLGFLSVVDWGGEAREFTDGECIVGANMALKVETARELGGFDAGLGRTGNPAVLMSNEEMDLRLRFQKAGKVLIWAPKAIVGHRIDANRITREWIRSRAAWQAVSDFLVEPDLASRKAYNLQWDLRESISPAMQKSSTIFGRQFRRKPHCDFSAEVRGVYAITVYALVGADPRKLLIDLGKES
jgi:glucosyl-dolichyl phosphate glucuronosyltransferase